VFVFGVVYYTIILSVLFVILFLRFGHIAFCIVYFKSP